MFDHYDNEKLLSLYQDWVQVNFYNPFATPENIVEARQTFNCIDVVEAEIIRRMERGFR